MSTGDLSRPVAPVQQALAVAARQASGLMGEDGLIATATLILVLALNAPFFQVPYFWDSLWIIPGAEHLLANGFRPVLPVAWDSEGHPVLFHELLALAWFVLGRSLWVSHLVVTVFTFLAVLYTYRLARLLYDHRTGITAALLLVCYPLFRAQSTVTVLDLPTAAFALMAIYYLLKSRTLLYVVCASAMVLTKGTGALLIPAVMLYVFLKVYRRGPWLETVATLVVHSIPVIILAAWFWYHKQTTGWWPFVEDGMIRPANALSAYLPPVLFTRGGAIYASLLLSWRVFGGLTPVGLLTLLILTRSFSFRLFFLPFGRRFSLQSIVAAIRAQPLWSTWGPKEHLVVLGLPIGLQLAFTSSTFELHRYLLPEYPLFFVLASKAIRDAFKPERLAVVATTVVLFGFVVGWTGWWSGYDIASPSNLAYLNFVRTQQEAAVFIEDKYTDPVVLAGWPQYIELSMPSMGYVRHPIRVIAYSLPLRYSVPRMISLGARYFTDPRDLTIDDFDLVYYSDHTDHADAPILRDVIERYGLPVIAEFRVGSEQATIYGNPHRVGIPARTLQALG